MSVKGACVSANICVIKLGPLGEVGSKYPLQLSSQIQQVCSHVLLYFTSSERERERERERDVAFIHFYIE